MSHPERGPARMPAIYSTRLAARLDGFRLDPVIGVEPDQVFDFLAQRHEFRLAEARVAAGCHDLAERALHRVERGAEQDLRVDAPAITHPLQFAEREDRPPVAIAATLYPYERHACQPWRRFGLLGVAREYQPEIGANLGGGVDPTDRLVEAELATGVGTRDDDEIGVGLVALPAGVFDLDDEFVARDRVHLIGVVMRPLRVELILDMDPGDPGGGEFAHRAHRVQRLAETGAGIGDQGHADRTRHRTGNRHLLVHRQQRLADRAR